MAKKPSQSGEEFADKLNALFAKIHPPGREFTNEEVSAGILQRGGVRITANYIGQLRSGRARNPSLRIIEALADFFGAPPQYFFDTGVQREVEEEIDAINALRDNDVRNLALRALDARGRLSPDVLRALTALLEQLGDGPSRRREGEDASADDVPADREEEP